MDNRRTMTFNELNLSAPLLRAVAEAGYESPSPIQASAIPPVLAGRDLMGCAQTGTGMHEMYPEATDKQIRKLLK